MPSLDDIVQIATGSHNGTATTITLPNPTTAGNTLIIAIATVGTSLPTGTNFSRDTSPQATTQRAYLLRRNIPLTDGETSWNLTGFGAAQQTAWVAMEVQGLNLIAPVDGVAPNSTTTGSTTLATGTIGQTTAYEGLAIAVHVGRNGASATIPTWSSQTNGWTEIQESGRADGATALGMAVSVRITDDVSSTLTTTGTASLAVDGAAVMVHYPTAGARRVPNIDVMSGAEHGTAAGLATGNAGNAPLDYRNGSVSVVSTDPRTGSYCYELTGAAAAANAGWNSTGALSLYTTPTGITDRSFYGKRLSFYMPTLPGADVAVAAIDTGTGPTGSGLTVTYRSASQKLGLTVYTAGTSGTEVLSDITIAAGQWYDLDLLWNGANADRAQLHRGHWQLNGVEQTLGQVTSATASTVTAVTHVRFGWLTASTATIRYDDIVCSRHPGHYPLGDQRIYPLTVDGAATPTVTAPAAFSTFTNNGTLNATFSTTTARNAVDEIPPTIGATADGFAQDATGAADYVELPMITRNAADNLQGIRGVRWYFPGWAADATAATIGFRAYDGAAETTLFAAADPNFDASTTTPAWVCRMHRTLAANTAYSWSQAKLDALAARVGFSTDAVPAVGVHAVIAEVAMKAATELQVVEVDGVFVYALLDPDSGAAVAYRLVAPVDSAATARYTVNGVDEFSTAPAGGFDLYVIGAADTSVVTAVTAYRS